MPDGPNIIVLSYGLWQMRYGGDRDVLGTDILLNGESYEVIGVMPEGFDFAEEGGESQFWIPVRIDPESADPGTFSFDAIARLKPGITEDAAVAQVEVLVERVRERWSDAQMFINFLDAGGFTPLVHKLQDEIVGDLEQPLWILLGTVGFVLLIACANVANLSLVRAESRQREMAVRSALGGGWWNVSRLYLTESALLAMLGGATGLLLAWAGMPALLGLAPPELPRLNEITLDGNVLLFTMLITALTAVLFGSTPALRYNIGRLPMMLRHSGRGMTSGRNQNRLRNLLVIGQTGLALVLLVGSGLLARSFWEISNTDPGFESEDILVFSLSLNGIEYPDASSLLSFNQQLTERLGSLPGVEFVGGVTEAPLRDNARGTAFDIEDFPTGPDELPPMFWFKYTTPDYFKSMGISLFSGRGFEPSDYDRNPGNIIVSKPAADHYWPDQDVIGKRIRFASDTTAAAWHQIVGVISGVRDRGLREDPSETIYFPIINTREERGWITRNLQYTVKGHNITSLAPAVRNQIWEINSNLPIARMETMKEVVVDSVVQLSFTTLALGIAALMALLLGAIGLYGVLSYVVSQRRSEIGVRMALGAPPETVLKMIVLSGARIAGLGLAAGLIGAFALTRLLQGLLYETEPLDPLTFTGMTLTLFIVGLLASYLPARRAAAVDPIESLKME
jgi:predicted permease